jgi:hypothetical protein
VSDARNLYLDLMKKVLTYYIWGESYQPIEPGEFPVRNFFVRNRLRSYLKNNGLQIVREFRYDPEKRAKGLDWPPLADTMIGLKRLDNLQMCVESVIVENVPGDVIETGVWRGGGSIFMKAILASYGIIDRTVWVADSFAGLPRPDPDKYPEDAGDIHHTIKMLAVSCEQVKNNFAKYGLLDDKVKFLQGWFKDTLPSAPIKALAIIRLDGDMYESTMDGLKNLYPKLSKGGYIIIDDYVLPPCRKAVYDYRNSHGITDDIVDIDGTGAFWKKTT